MSARGSEKGLQSKSNRCPICEIYQTKIEEVEQSLTGRDAIISLLQNRLDKCEKNYKNLFDDFEKLRFQHCTALQDNYSLKEINSKLEEFDLKGNSAVKNYPPDQNMKSHFDSNRSCQDCKASFVQMDNNNNHKVVLKQLLDKIVTELKLCKCPDPEVSTNYTKTDEDFKNVESGDYMNKDPEIQGLLNEIETLKTSLNKYEQENESMRQLLSEKKENLSVCQNILEDTSKSINKISSSIDNLVKHNSAEKKTRDNCCDAEVTASNTEEQVYTNKIAELELEMKQKEKEYEKCKSQMLIQMNDISDNNQILSETLEIIKAENKNNLETIAKLKDELRKGNDETEASQKDMKYRISELENELEGSLINEKKLKETLEKSNNEVKALKKRLKLVLDEITTKECTCVHEIDLKQKIDELEGTNKEIKKDLNEKALELNEYEEENRALSQKVASVTKNNDNLQQKIYDLEEQLYEKIKQLEKGVMNNQMSADFSAKDLEKQVSQLENDNRCLTDACKSAKNEANKKSVEIDGLKNSIKIQMNELDKLSKENADLQEKLERQKCECKKETERLQSIVNHSQRQVELLLKEHDEKTAQIQNVANELDGIRKSVTEENNNFLSKIEQLEQERDELKKKLKDIESDPKKNKNCDCETDRSEIDRLKADVIKKQCAILELEKAMNEFNITMKQFEQNIVDLDKENTCLKIERDNQIKELEDLKNELNNKIKEIGKIHEELDDLKIISKNLKKDNQSLEIENEKLKNEVDNLKFEQNRSKRISETENLALQMELEVTRKEESKKCSALSAMLENSQKAFEELKSQCATKCLENEKLREDLQNSKKIMEELKSQAQYLEFENDRLKNQNRASFEEQYKISEKMDHIKENYEKVKKSCAIKCIENEELKQQLDDQTNSANKCVKDCEEIRKKLFDTERELFKITEKYNEILKMYDVQSEQLRKAKKQYEGCYKQAQITREEYNNLRKEYKEIKSMLSDQIKKYKRDTGTVEGEQFSQKSCKAIRDLKKQLLEKEDQMVALQQKLKDASYEIIELKDYIHKLISDNNILKSAINNLIGNLERKIKGPSFGSLPNNSADAIAGEILQSLTNIESTIMKKSGCTNPDCTNTECDCMSKIQSQYKDPQQGSSTSTDPGNAESPNPCISVCCPACGFKNKPNFNNDSGSTNNGNIKNCTYLNCKRKFNFVSDPSTTDSEDCHCAFMDKKSVEFFKDAIQVLKSSRDSTMKEKSCDCEPYR